MTGRNWLLSGIVATMIMTSGCITPGFEGARLAQEAGPTCDVPLANRNQVYVFVVGGNNPLEIMALDKFREGINSQGYAKVATGPSIYYLWMASELRRIHKEEPNAVFVIAGLDSSASTAAKLSEKAASEGIPIAGVVIVDPTGTTPKPQCGGRTLMVGATYSILTNSADESLVITAPGELGLAAEPRTIAEVAEMLNEIAVHNPTPPTYEPPSESSYPFAPDVLTTVEPKQNSEWSFLFDRPAGVTRAMNDPLPPKTQALTPGSSTASK
jgi:hypothetical protein